MISMKKSGLAIGAMVALIAIFFYNGFFGIENTSYSSQEEQEVHFHAGFIVYEDNQQLDFSDMKYMHIEPCTLDGHEEEEDDQAEKAHLHDSIGDVVHVHRENAVWNDFFTNIEYQLKLPVTGYVDGTFYENILDEKITPFESVVILSGENTDIETKIHRAVSIDHIRKVEESTESC